MTGSGDSWMMVCAGGVGVGDPGSGTGMTGGGAFGDYAYRWWW
jgi:hypothetical protein